MRDAREVAQEMYNNISIERYHAGRDAALKLLAEDIRDRDLEVIEACKTTVPSNWLDPLLTGPHRVVREDCATGEIEALLRAVRNRLDRVLEEKP